MGNDIKTNNNISLIILYSDDNKNSLNTVIDSVFSQSIFPSEIIIVDNSKKGIDHIDQLYRTIILKTGPTSRARARNIGVSHSQGDILVFIDGDTFFACPNALEKIQQYSKTYSHGYGAKRLWTYPQNFYNENRKEFNERLKENDFDWIIKNSIWPTESNKYLELDNLTGYSFPGNMGFISKKLFKKVEGFDERFVGYGFEDDHIAYKLYKADMLGFINLSSISVMHIYHSSKDANIYESNRNSVVFQEILKKDGVKSFNINVLFGLPDFIGEEVIEI